MHAREQFDFDSIACPNTFEDDPKVDVFFDRVMQSSKRELLRKTTLMKNNSSARCQKMSLAESAKKNIQKRAQSFRQKFLPQRKSKSAGVTEENHIVSVPEQITPVCQVACKPPLLPPRTRRVGPRSKEVKAECTPKQDSVKRHAWGRWSFPPADPLTYSVDPDDVKVAQTTPLRSKRIALKQAKKATDSTVTPKRKKSVAKATRIRFEPRDSLRRASLRKSIAKLPKPSKIPKTSKIPVVRKPYADVRSKVGEVIRSVLPRRTKPAVQSMAVKMVKPPSSETNHASRGCYPAGKTLAQLVKEFQRCPRQFSHSESNRKDNRSPWKTYF